MTLKESLTAYLKANEGWHASGSLQRMEWRDSKGKLATPSNLSRRLRELAEEGKIEVQYRANHAYYSYTPQKKVISQVVEVDGKFYEKRVEVEV